MGFEKISINLYDRLFNCEFPDQGKDLNFQESINKSSLKIIDNACAEKNIKNTSFNHYYQFQRKGYFKLEKNNNGLSFNRTVTLRDNWKIKEKI